MIEMNTQAIVVLYIRKLDHYKKIILEGKLECIKCILRMLIDMYLNTGILYCC